MIRHFGIAIVVVLCVAAVSIAATPLQRGQRGAAPRPGPPHDPHDLNGIWLLVGPGDNGHPESQWSPEKLPFTPAGRTLFDSRKPGKGPRAGLPANGNDPLSNANVPGLLRTLVYSRPFQLIQAGDKTVQLFEWFRIWREIWTDDRKMPEDPGPRFYGYSVGKWDGDTFVVETTGLDSRLWGDEWGMPFSEDMVVTERWHRLDRDNMELTATFNDPKMYTKPWTSDPSRFRLQAKGTPNGELLEVIFAPMDEENFNSVIRDLSNGVK